MSFLRIARQPLLRPLARNTPRATFTTHTRLAAGQDYGGGDESAPPGQKPSEQTGKNPSEHLEHPGPAPPSVAGGKQKEASSQESGAKDATTSNSSSSSQGQSSKSKGTQDAQPKILNENPPSGENAPEDVREHNKDMDQRAEKSQEKASDEDVKNDKVGKGFWSGQGGADRDP